MKEYIGGDACTLCHLGEYCDEYKKDVRFKTTSACNLARIRYQNKVMSKDLPLRKK